MILNRFIPFAVLGFLLIQCTDTGNYESEPVRQYTHYQMDMTLQPSNRTFECDASIRFTCTSDSTDRLILLINRHHTIESVYGDYITGYRLDSTSAGCDTLPDNVILMRLGLDSTFMQGDNVTVRIVYNGYFPEWSSDSTAVMQTPIFEIHNAFDWYPKSPDCNYFTYDIRLNLDTAFVLCGPQNIMKTDEGFTLTNNTPGSDIIFAGALDYKEYSLSDNDFSASVFHCNLHDSTVGSIAGNLLLTDQLISNWFGEQQQLSSTVFVSSRSGGGNYARSSFQSLIFLTDSSYNHGYHNFFLFSVREKIKRFWKRPVAQPQDNWLNEGIIEYLTFLAARELGSREMYDSLLIMKTNTAGSLPSVLDIDFSDENADSLSNKVYNTKAPLILAELEEQTGRDTFLILMREIADLDTLRTDSIVSKVERVTNYTTARSFKRALESF